MARGAPLLSLACLGAGLAACSLGALSGFSGAPPDGADSGTASGGATDGPSPQPTDGGLGDDSSTTVIAGDAGDGSTTGFCATNTPDGGFCDDFDTSGLTRFDDVLMSNASVALDTTGFLSAPSSILANAPASADPARAMVIKSLGVADATRIRIALSVRLEKNNTLTSLPMQFAKTRFYGTGGVSYEIGVGVRGKGDQMYIFDYAPVSATYNILADLGALPLSTWRRVVLSVRIGQTSDASASVDGVPRATAIPLSPPLTAGRPECAGGIAFANGNHDGWTIRVDDLTCDTN